LLCFPFPLQKGQNNLDFGSTDLSTFFAQNYSLKDFAGNRINFRVCNFNKQLIFWVGFHFIIHHSFVKPLTNHCGAKLGKSPIQ
jgi:hypothetical protein